mmetsp:Transcript_29259/g.73010  ORF Transcript_29259/g.73010 Transcript_29259/m.73010 type:complete len:93 (-) Transcript_29259:1857-2135(-)
MSRGLATFIRTQTCRRALHYWLIVRERRAAEICLYLAEFNPMPRYPRPMSLYTLAELSLPSGSALAPVTHALLSEPPGSLKLVADSASLRRL